MHLSVFSQNQGEIQTSSGYKEQQNQATSLLGTAATCGTINCFYSGHWMSPQCKGIKILQWNSFGGFPGWSNSSSPRYISTFLTPLTGFFGLFSFAWSFGWLLWFGLVFWASSLLKAFPWNAPVTCNKAGSYHSAFFIIAPSFSAHRLLRNEHFKQNTVHS